jgi:hypothetical protein
MVIHTYNPSTQEAEAEESVVQDQPELLYSKTLYQKNFFDTVNLTIPFICFQISFLYFYSFIYFGTIEA